jgi:Zn finger protein HypA/HybF involved in hydrogenase expression
MCRNEANSDSWWTTEQIENAKEQAQRHVVSKINNALNEGAKEFNQKNSKNSFLNISIKVKGGVSKYQVIPIPSKESLELKIQCNNCSARFSVIGSAFFCPCCGYNSAEQTFDQSLEKIEIKIKSLENIRNGLQNVSRDVKENICNKEGSNCVEAAVYTIDLENGESIKVTQKWGVLHVSVSAKGRSTFGSSVGIMGHFSKPGLLGRDEVSKFTDPNLFGQEWQVLSTEPRLFHEQRTPIHPEQCILPEETRRRLGESTVFYQLAEEACAEVEESSKEFCIFDVTAAGVAEAAAIYYPARKE